MRVCVVCRCMQCAGVHNVQVGVRSMQRGEPKNICGRDVRAAAAKHP